MKRTGSIEQTSAGRWRVRMSINGERKTVGRRGETFATREEAAKALAVFSALVATSEIELPGSPTLASFGLRWLDNRELHGSDDRVAVKSVSDERSVWNRHVAGSPLANLRLETITTQDVQAFTRYLRDRRKVSAITRKEEGERVTVLRETNEKLSWQTQKHALRLVKQSLEAARIDGHIEKNPAEGISVLPQEGRKRDVSDDWLRADEIEKLLSCESISVRDRTVFACAIGLALRLNDLKGLRPEDVDLDRQVPGPHVRVHIAKSNKAHRVPVLGWLAPILRAHLNSLPKSSRWLFPTREGLRYHADSDFGWAPKRDGERYTAGALERAGITLRIRFHDLRGTCATHLAIGSWGRRWSLQEVQAMLAHSDQRVTERYVRRALDALSSAAADTTSGPTAQIGRTAHDLPTTSIFQGSEKRANYPESFVTGPAGFEPATFGSGGSREVAQHQTVADTVDQVVDRAQAVLTSADSDSMHALAAAVLETAATAPAELVMLALQVRDPATPHRARKAIQLAELVLAQASVNTTQENAK